EGEEVEMLLGMLARGGGRQQHRVVVEVGDDGTGGLLGQPSGLEPDLAATEVTVVYGGDGLEDPVFDLNGRDLWHTYSCRVWDVGHAAGWCRGHRATRFQGAPVRPRSSIEAAGSGASPVRASPGSGSHYRGPSIGPVSHPGTCAPATGQAIRENTSGHRGGAGASLRRSSHRPSGPPVRRRGLPGDPD